MPDADMQLFLPEIINCNFVPYFSNNIDKCAADLTPIVCGLNMTGTFSQIAILLSENRVFFVYSFFRKKSNTLSYAFILNCI